MGMHMTYGEFATYLGYVGMIFGPPLDFSEYYDRAGDRRHNRQKRRAVFFFDLVGDVGGFFFGDVSNISTLKRTAILNLVRNLRFLTS